MRKKRSGSQAVYEGITIEACVSVLAAHTGWRLRVSRHGVVAVYRCFYAEEYGGMASALLAANAASRAFARSEDAARNQLALRAPNPVPDPSADVIRVPWWRRVCARIGSWGIAS